MLVQPPWGQPASLTSPVLRSLLHRNFSFWVYIPFSLEGNKKYSPWIEDLREIILGKFCNPFSSNSEFHPNMVPGLYRPFSFPLARLRQPSSCHYCREAHNNFFLFIIKIGIINQDQTLISSVLNPPCSDTITVCLYLQIPFHTL